MRVTALGELCQGRQRLLKIRHGLAVRRARHGLGPSLPAVEEGLVPHLAPHGMVRQAVDLLGQALCRECLQRLNNPAVEDTPPLLEQRCCRPPRA